MVRGVRAATDSYDVSEYAAQSNLVMHLDGLRNAGPRKAHDPSATEWANLADAANPAVINQTSKGYWTGGCGYHFLYDGATSYARLKEDAPAMTQATFEFVIEGSIGDQAKKDWGCTFLSGDGNGYVCSVDASGQIRFVADDWTGSNACRPSISGWSWKQASFTLGSSGGDSFRPYDQGVLKTPVSAGSTGENGIPATKWMVGNRISSLAQNMQFTGTMKSVRIYNRALTADEVKANADIDSIRFDGVLLTTNVVVAAKYSGYDGVQPGEYEVVGHYDFTAGAAADGAGAPRSARFYTLETWNAGTGEWGDPVWHVGGTYRYTTGTDPDKVRLTWKWTPGGMVMSFR